MKQMFSFNQAYSLFKINPSELEAREIWESIDENPYFKMIAQFNLAIINYYYNLSTKERK